MKGKKILQLWFLKSIGMLLLVLSFAFSSGLAQNADNLLMQLSDAGSGALEGSDDSTLNLMKIVTLQEGEIQQTVQGVVSVAMSGESLPGVNVLIKGTTQGTATGIDGSYSLSVSSLQDTLVFSFIGFQTQEVPIQGRTEIDVNLQYQAISGDELVVVGYGTQQLETLTGSISRVSGDDIAVSPSVNVTSSLAGRLPGLVVNQRTGLPGEEDINILIRGNATFGDDSPLIVIDGVPRGNLQRLNPQDIESVTVLKDASAAIYGARAANGVILVTTKAGSLSDGPNFSFSSSYAVHEPTQIPEMMDAVLFAEVYNEAEWYRQGRPDMNNFTPFFTETAIENYRNRTDPVLYPNTNWPEATMKSSYQRKVNLQASGGSENVRYLLSFGYTDQDGNLRNNPTSYTQYNTRARVDADLTEDLTVTANINAMVNERNRSGNTIDWVNILQSNPTLAAEYPNGLIAPGRFRNNPLLSNQRGFNDTKDYPIYTSFSANYAIPYIDGLLLETSYNYDLRNEFQKSFSTNYIWHEYNVQTGEFDRFESQQPVTLEDNYRRWQSSLFNTRISYSTTVGFDHNIFSMVGFEQQKEEFSFARAYRMNFVSSAIPQIDAGSSDAEDQENNGSGWESAYNNFFGRFNYDYQSKYLFEFVFRYDGSQIFPDGNRYGFFPALSLGWRLSEEDFFRDNVPYINELKLRGSYGQMGNDRVGQFQYLQAFQFGGNYVFGGSDAPGIFSSALANPNITWEKSTKLDIGLVAEMWDGLLGADLTFFHENRSDILLARNLSVPNTFGFPDLPTENIGEVNNRGFEFMLTHRNTVGDFAYSIEANTSFSRSEIVFMDETPPNEDYQFQTGFPLGSGLYYKSDGIFNTQEELDNYPHATGTQVGDIKIVDLNGDGVINGDDRYRSRNTPTPEYVFSLNTSFRYKAFDLTMFFYGQTNAHSYDGILTEMGEQDLDNNTVFAATNRWTVNNQEGATMPRADGFQPGSTDFFLYDATFIRLKNLELGFNLPASLLNRVRGLRGARIYANGTNLLTWAKEITWRDPEIQGNYTTYPPLRVVNFGVNIEF